MAKQYTVEVANKTRTRIDPEPARRVAEKFLKKYGYQEVSIVFVGDSLIRKLNRIYRKKDRVTDVLAFEGDNGFLGEVIIDYRQIKRQAAALKTSVKNELIFILVHGLFHCLGYSDETEAQRKKMIRLGEEFIKKLELGNKD